MSTAAAVASAPEAAPISGDPNAFTPDEIAMMEGKAPEAKPAPTPVATTGAPSAQPEDGNGEAEEDIDGEIEIGADGAPRDLKTGRFVPRAAFLRTKAQNKELTERTNRLAAEVVRNRERLAIYSELQPAKGEEQPAKKEPPKQIDPSEDIFGAFNQAVEKIKSLEEQITKSSTDTQARLDAKETDDYFRSDLAKIQSAKPDFDKALQHAVLVQDKIYQRRGITDAAERQKMVMSEIHGIIQASKAAGTSWAETVYGIAEDYGYKPEAAPTTAGPTDEARANIERITRGQEAAASLRGAGAGGVPETMTVAKLADMSEREFLKVHAEYVGRNGVQAWNDFMAGKRVW